MSFQPGAPDPTEYSPAFEGYVSLSRHATDPVARLAEQRDEVLALLHSIAPAKRLYRYAPGKWSIQELLGHLTDTERVFAYRLLRIARADTTPLPGFDENAWAVAGEADLCEWSNLVNEFDNVRQASVLLLKNLPAAAWTRTGTSNNHATSVRALAYIMIGHTERHIAVLRERYLN